MSYNFIISRERNCGKTTIAKGLIDKGIITKGILSLSNDAKNEYSAFNIESGEKRTLLSENIISSSTFGRFKVSDSAFSWANDYLSSIESGVVLIDEIGRLELLDKGFASSLKELLKKDVTLYLTVRTSFLDEVVKTFNIENYRVLNGSDE